MKCRTSFLQKVVIFLDDLHGEVWDCTGFVSDPPVPREKMLMAWVAGGDSEGRSNGRMGIATLAKVRMASSGLGSLFLEDFAAWNSAKKSLS